MKKCFKKIVLTLILAGLTSSIVCPHLNSITSLIYTNTYISPFSIPNTPKSVNEY